MLYKLFIAMLALLAIAVPLQRTEAQDVVWQGEYYNNPYLSGDPALVRNDPSINFNWGVGSPAAEINVDNFSVRWSTNVNLPAGTYRFWAQADDNIRVTFNFNDVVIDTFEQDTVGQLQTGDVNVPETGSYHIQVDYQEFTGNAYAYVSFANVAASQPAPTFGLQPPTPAPGPQWVAEYFANPNLIGPPVAIITETTPSHNWGTGAPLPSVPADNFSVRWTSNQFLQGGLHRLTVRADDGVRVYVNGVLIIDQWQLATGQTYTADLNLPTGNNNFVVEYFEAGGTAFIDYSLIPVVDGATAVPQPPAATAIVTTGRLNVRNAPSIQTGQILTVINQNESYPVVARSEDGAWHLINVRQTQGWVSSQWINISPAGANIPIIGVDGALPTPPPATGELMVTATPFTVNIRTGPGTQFERIARLPATQSAQVIGRNTNNTWWQINYVGITGWVSAQYAIIQQGANIETLPITG